MTRLIICIISIGLFSCQGNKKPRRPLQTENAAAPLWDSLKKYTVSSFLTRIAGYGCATIEDDETPASWVTAQDVDTLLSLIHSKKPCACVVDPLSSFKPVNTYANTGGYAILFLQQYRDKKPIRFKLYDCPKTNKDEAAEILEWAKTRR